MRKEGELVKGLTKILVRIKKSQPADHTYNDFREKLHKMRVDIYDVYEGDKGVLSLISGWNKNGLHYPQDNV